MRSSQRAGKSPILCTLTMRHFESKMWKKLIILGFFLVLKSKKSSIYIRAGKFRNIFPYYDSKITDCVCSVCNSNQSSRTISIIWLGPILTSILDKGDGPRPNRIWFGCWHAYKSSGKHVHGLPPCYSKCSETS